MKKAALAIENVYEYGYKYIVKELLVEPTTSEKHILMIGKSGVGKSLLGNVLLGKNFFKVGDGSMSCTKGILRKKSQYRKITVYDSQGLMDTFTLMKMTEVHIELSRTKIIASKISYLFSKLGSNMEM